MRVISLCTCAKRRVGANVQRMRKDQVSHGCCRGAQVGQDTERFQHGHLPESLVRPAGPVCCVQSLGMAPHRRHQFAIRGRCIRMVRLSFGFGKQMKQFYTASLATVAGASCVDCEAAVTASTAHSWTRSPVFMSEIVLSARNYLCCCVRANFDILRPFSQHTTSEEIHECLQRRNKPSTICSLWFSFDTQRIGVVMLFERYVKNIMAQHFIACLPWKFNCRSFCSSMRRLLCAVLQCDPEPRNIHSQGRESSASANGTIGSQAGFAAAIRPIKTANASPSLSFTPHGDEFCTPYSEC